MTKKYKHKQTGKIVIEKDTFYYLESEGNLPKWAVENSNDWEFVEEKEYKFTTHDGVLKYTGDSYCFIDKYEMKNIYDNTVVESWSKRSVGHSRYIRFSTKKAAQKYIDENTKKPILTTEDGVEMFEGDIFWYVDLEDDSNIIESRICEYTKKENMFKDFSTEQAAKDYVNLHKPKFSKQEIADILKETVYCTGYIYLFNCKDE